MLGLDYSLSRPDPAYIKSQGFDFVMRYLSFTPAKNISPTEAQALLAAGVSIGLVWETYAERPLSGYTGGASDAQAAYAQAQAAGQPIDRPIYFAVDWDASGGELALIDEYLHGAASVIGADRVGVYGSYRVVKHCHESGSAAWFWQTYAWSGGAIYPEAHLYQYSNGEWNGAVDFNEAKPADFGQWPYQSEEASDEEDEMHLPEGVFVDDEKTTVEFSEIDTRDPKNPKGGVWLKIVPMAKAVFPLKVSVLVLKDEIFQPLDMLKIDSAVIELEKPGDQREGVQFPGGMDSTVRVVGPAGQFTPVLKY